MLFTRTRTICSTAFLLLLGAATAWGQANGNLQLHFIDVGQGDGALMITPAGKVVLFDAGMDLGVENCTKITSYLDQLGITAIDAIVVSHYHTDHIGCLPEVLEGRTLSGLVYDRGQSYTTQSYKRYVAAVKEHRQATVLGDTVSFDTGANQVLMRVIAVNGAGVPTTNENDLSVAVTVAFGNFRAEIGGDLSGEDTDNYADIETVVAPNVGPLDVYKVHHHCSKYSTNANWLLTTSPTVGIISTGDTNTYGHPAPACLDRLHQAGTKMYWTERGNGGPPTAGVDKIGKNIIVEMAPGANTYTVQYSGGTDTHALKNTAGTPPPIAPKFSWSARPGARLYHLSTCAYVGNISPANLQRGDTPPPNKTLHADCPVHH
ncbi:MBL fold metallo-hydrolase [uncultured Paludibaculum sp.]|uniref:ComEC/Rec2 family competence protein n=1 Tax=uncultured Paludibaculum sp. TaxID=1765020 RepID=UPI002AAAA8D2|nr:MBL fold metallo-hydrolase [uncultured Paludibaculum sp.]